MPQSGHRAGRGPKQPPPGILLEIQIFLLRLAAAQKVAGEIASSLAEKGLRLGDSFPGSMAEKAEISLLQQVRRVLRPHAAREKPQQIPAGRRQRGK